MTVLGLFASGWIAYIRDQFALARPRALADDLLVSTIDEEAEFPEQEHFEQHREAVDATVRFLQAAG
eukprot:3731219-Alexandrium_andersonii.AAC.1